MARVTQVRGDCTVPEYLLTYAQRDLNLTVFQVIVLRPLISFLLFDVEFYSEFILTAVCGSDVTLWQPRQGLICFMTFCHFMTFVDKQTGRNKNRDVNVYLEQGPWLILGAYTKQQKANNQVWIISPAISQCKCGTSARCGLEGGGGVVDLLFTLLSINMNCVQCLSSGGLGPAHPSLQSTLDLLQWDWAHDLTWLCGCFWI